MSLSIPKIRKLRALRERIVLVLFNSHGLSRQDICKTLWNDPVVGVTTNPGTMQAAVGEALHIYDRDFYQDPSTRRWMLTAGRRQIEELVRNSTTVTTGHRFGATYASKTGEAIDAR